MARQKIDTNAIGLDAGLGFIRWLTGAENLHYGLWTGLPVQADNVGAAQAAVVANAHHLRLGVLLAEAALLSRHNLKKKTTQ